MTDPRDVGIREAAVQRGLLELLTLYGWRTWRIGQRDARGTQDPGVSDLLSTHPDDGILFTEAKRPVGYRQSRAQREFEAHVVAAGGRYVLAPSVDALRVVLDELRARRVTHTPAPPSLR